MDDVVQVDEFEFEASVSPPLTRPTSPAAPLVRTHVEPAPLQLASRLNGGVTSPSRSPRRRRVPERLDAALLMQTTRLHRFEPSADAETMTYRTPLQIQEDARRKLWESTIFVEVDELRPLGFLRGESVKQQLEKERREVSSSSDSEEDTVYSSDILHLDSPASSEADELHDGSSTEALSADWLPPFHMELPVAREGRGADHVQQEKDADWLKGASLAWEAAGMARPAFALHT